jgi:signal transduction histidine kinase
MEERGSDDLLLLSYELYDGASRLAGAAAARERVRERWILGVVAAVVISAIGATALTVTVTTALLARRLSRLEDGADRIAAGDLAHRTGMAGDDAIARVGWAFDAMAERLAANVRQLESSNRDLEAFSASVSHDLRTPLRHLRGFVDLLAERSEAGLDEKSRHYLQVIREAALRMGELIDDLLALSRLSRAALVPQEVQLRPLVDEVVVELAGNTDHSPEVVWEIGPLPAVVADPGLLRLVLANLLGNALKFTRTRPVARIAVAARDEGDEVQVWVRDNGVGFDPRHAGELFGVFQRLHRAEEFEGNGIGLANVRQIVSRHGGRTWAEGREGEGATFGFSLPLGRGGAPLTNAHPGRPPPPRPKVATRP